MRSHISDEACVARHAVCGRRFMNQTVSLFLLLLYSALLGVCFVFPVPSSRSSLCRCWSRRSTKRRSSPLFPHGRSCPTSPPSKSAFPPCSSTKSTSGRSARHCPHRQAPSGKEGHATWLGPRQRMKMNKYFGTVNLRQCPVWRLFFKK